MPTLEYVDDSILPWRVHWQNEKGEVWQAFNTQAEARTFMETL